jgi:hypothetical protein
MNYRRLVLVAVIALVGSTSHAQTHSGWTVMSSGSLHRYGVQGNTVNDHQFALLQRTPQCDTDTLWINWTTTDRSAPIEINERVLIQLDIDGTVGQVIARILMAKDIGHTTLFVMTNFVVGEELLKLLERGHTVTVRPIAPAELVKHLDVAEDSFSLSGFAASRAAAHAKCRGE